MVLSCVDFFENYTMKIQNEVQSMNRHNFQVNTPVHISYRHNFSINPIDANSSIIKEVHYYVFDDPNHDFLYVQHVFMLH
jgi:hypothetical protein